MNESARPVLAGNRCGNPLLLSVLPPPETSVGSQRMMIASYQDEGGEPPTAIDTPSRSRSILPRREECSPAAASVRPPMSSLARERSGSVDCDSGASDYAALGCAGAGRGGRVWRIRSVLVVALLATLGLGAVPSLAGVRSSASAVPLCPPGTPVRNPHPDCLFRPYAYPKQAATFDGTARVTAAPKRVGTSWNQEFTVTVHYSVPYAKVCPDNVDPASPCITEVYPGATGKSQLEIGIVGAYVPGARTLEDVSPLSVTRNCPEASGTCVETFELNTYSIWGHFDFVVSMPLGYNVPYSWDGNIYGGASFETAISVTFAKLKGSSKVMLLPPG